MKDFTDIRALPKYHKGISIFPVKLKDMYLFYKYLECLLFNKNKIPDINIIKMSYLRFLLEYSTLVAPDGKSFIYLLEYFIGLSELIFKTKPLILEEDKQYFLQLGDNIINEYEFDNIRNIIFEQNMIKISDIFDPEVEKALKETEEYLAKKNQPATMEELIISYHVATGIKYDDIFEYSIYQFNKSIDRLNALKSWEVYYYPFLKCGETEKLPHWLGHIDEKDVLDNLTVSKEDFNKLTADSGIFLK
jgi:hypothetical protein